MSNRLGGKQGTAYLGTNANQPPNWVFSDRDPSQYDINNVSLGDMWLNQDSENVWILVSLAGVAGSKGSLATWVKLESNAVTGVLDTLTGDTGGVIQGDVNANINIVSGIPGLSFDGNAGTNTVTLNSTISGQVVQTLTGNNGGAIDPLAGNINIEGDNVGVTVVGNPLTNTLLISLVGGDDAAQDFPTDSGTASSINGILNINAGNSGLSAGSSVSFFEVATNTVRLGLTDGNLNTIIGNSSGNLTLSGNSNVGLGVSGLIALTSGDENVALGNQVGQNLTSGSGNIFIGDNAGSGTTTEDYNINLNSGSVVGQSNTLRIGSGTGAGVKQLNKSFIHGIYGTTPITTDGIPVFIGSDGQLGTVGNGDVMLVGTITADAGVVVSPLAGNITIVGDGVTATVTGNAGTHTLTIAAVGGGGGVLNDLIDDNGNVVVPLVGQINVITDNAIQGAGSSVIFDGTVANTLTLKVSDAIDNTIIGEAAGNGTLTGIKNVGLGTLGLASLTTGSDNVTVGYGAGTAITTGSYNVLLGYLAGSTYVSNESSNININSIGTVTESNVLRIGSATGAGATQLSKSFIHGIDGVTPDTADGIPVFVGSAGQLGTVGTGGTMLVSTIEADGGVFVSPLAGNIKIIGDGATATVTGNAGTHTLTIAAVGGGGGVLNNLSGDDGSVVVPNAGQIDVITNNAALGAGSSVKFTGAVANTLTLEVTDASNNTIIGKSSGNLTLTGTKNTVLAASAGSALTTGTSNLFIGYQAGSLVTTGTGNFLCGDASLNAALKGSTTATGLYSLGASTGKLFLHNKGGQANGNTFVGYDSGVSSIAPNNTSCGVSTFNSMTTGFSNVAFGHSAGSSFISGSHNTFIGRSAGENYISSESSNICIGSQVTGTSFESNVLRIAAGTGTGNGQVNKTFISGIRGITTGSANAIPVLIDSNGQLGTAGGSALVSTLTGNSGGAVSSSGGNIDVVGDGATITVTGNPGLNKLTISAIGSSSTSSFSAYLTTDVPYLAATVTQIIYDTLVYNNGSDFNLGTSTFTAPITGIYNFSVGFGLSGGSSANPRGYMQIVTSHRTYVLVSANFSNLNWSATVEPRHFVLGNNIYADMDAGDTVIIQFFNSQAGGTPVVTGSSSPAATGVVNFFSGKLV